MALINLRQFRGEVPAVEPHLLPAAAAQLAQNCEFSSGALRSRQGGLSFATMANNPVRGIFTIDGLNFYTWNSDTIALRSPILGDVYNRMYFLRLSEGVLRVAQTLAMAPNGPTPASSWRAGVPKPVAAPVLTLVDRTTLPDYPNATVRMDVWWEYGGKVYNKARGSSYTTVTAFKSYRVPIPAKGTDVPEDATLAVTMAVESNGAEISSVTVRPSGAVRSQSFPGTQEYTVNVAAQLELTIAWSPEETRAYVYVNQNDWKEESGPSPAATISPTYLQDVRIACTTTDFTGYRPFQQFNLYRTYGATANYVGAKYISVNATTLQDDSRSPGGVLGVMESVDWDTWPAGLQGLEAMPGGIVASFVGTDLYVSDPYRPHAAPYIFTFPASIRGICAGQQSLVVTTADGLYVLAGASPASAKPIKISLPQPGIAQRSMENIDGGVVYASNDGIALVDGAAATMETSYRLFGRRRWRELFGDILGDASMRFGYQDGRLIACSHTQAKGFVLRFDEDAGSMVRISERFDALFRLPVDDALFYSVGNQLFRFQAGAEQEFTWQSKDFIFAKAETFGCGFLRGTPVQLQLVADGVVVHTATVNPGYFRLPSLPWCVRMSIILKGTGHVEEFMLGRNMQELKSA